MQTSNNFLTNIKNGVVLWLQRFFYNPYKKVNINAILLKYLKHIPPGKLRHHKLLKNETWFINGQEYLHGIREIFIDEIYKQVLPTNAHILDCGANIGLSVIYLKKICPTANIVAFEPDQRNFELLKKNIESHSLKNVELRNQAVWKEDAILSFESEGSMSSKIIEIKRDEQSTTVKAVRLKNLLDNKVDFLKIDIEGAEFKVLKDIEEALTNVNAMFIEYHGNFAQNEELVEIFEILNRQRFFFYIKEATNVYKHPFIRRRETHQYDLQLNLFCFRNVT
jgi:FkbM family methyltransferase